MIKKKKTHPKSSVVIVASGNSTRFGENKLLIDIFGETVIERTVAAFAMHDLIYEVILVCRQDDMLKFAEICSQFDNVKLVNGGENRTISSLNGINACSNNAEFIGIHDGARPLVTPEIITDVLTSSFETQACIPVVPVKDTIKGVKDNVCFANFNREELFCVQTPQFFKKEIILNSTEKAVSKNIDFTDNSTCVEYFGTKVHTVLGSYENIKITTKEDVSLAHLYIESREYL